MSTKFVVFLCYRKESEKHKMAASLNEKDPELGLKYLYLSPVLSDVEIKFKEGTLQAHKNVLSSKNEVFHSMFSHDTSEANTGIIEITDCDMQTFKVFLKYLYTGLVEDEEITENLLIPAVKYLEQKLQIICEKKLQQYFSNENVGRILILSVKYKCNDLKKKALEFIAKNLCDYMESYAHVIHSDPEVRIELYSFLGQLANTSISKYFKVIVAHILFFNYH